MKGRMWLFPLLLILIILSGCQESVLNSDALAGVGGDSRGVSSVRVQLVDAQMVERTPEYFIAIGEDAAGCYLAYYGESWHWNLLVRNKTGVPISQPNCWGGELADFAIRTGEEVNIGDYAGITVFTKNRTGYSNEIQELADHPDFLRSPKKIIDSENSRFYLKEPIAVAWTGVEEEEEPVPAAMQVDDDVQCEESDYFITVGKDKYGNNLAFYGEHGEWELNKHSNRPWFQPLFPHGDFVELALHSVEEVEENPQAELGLVQEKSLTTASEEVASVSELSQSDMPDLGDLLERSSYLGIAVGTRKGIAVSIPVVGCFGKPWFLWWLSKPIVVCEEENGIDTVSVHHSECDGPVMKRPISVRWTGCGYVVVGLDEECNLIAFYGFPGRWKIVTLHGDPAFQPDVGDDGRFEDFALARIEKRPTMTEAAEAVPDLSSMSADMEKSGKHHFPMFYRGISVGTIKLAPVPLAVPVSTTSEPPASSLYRGACAPILSFFYKPLFNGAPMNRNPEEIE